MKNSRPIAMCLGAAALLGAGFWLGSHWRTTRETDSSPAHVDSNPQQKSSTRSHPNIAPATRPSPAVESGALPKSPREIVAHLAALRVNAQDPRGLRALVSELERLRESGAAALPAIREFLTTGQDVDYDAVTGKSLRGGTMPTDFSVPPSLRLGLLEILKNVGGPEAEALLLHELQTTGRGVEVAYLASVLQQISPEKYRAPALTATRELLAMPLATRAQNPLDRSERDYLYGVLTTAGDRSLLPQAQAQLVLPNGQLDQGALRYLQQALGDQILPIASQAWHDPRVEVSQREPLARIALTFVGRNDSAEQLYRTAIDDPGLSANARQNLIEDLNETGFPEPKRPTVSDLPLIEKRLALIEQLAPHAKDRTNAAAFVEARKDLLNMRDTILARTASTKR